MFLSSTKEMGFIHVPKSAGTTIKGELERTLGNDYHIGRGKAVAERIRSLKGENDGSPAFHSEKITHRESHDLAQYPHHLERHLLEKRDERWCDYKIFAVIRNPWDRLMGAFLYRVMKDGPAWEKDGDYLNDFNFEYWLKDEHDKQWPHIFLHPLSTWVKETDTVMKFENLKNDIHILNDYLGFELDLGIHRNKSFKHLMGIRNSNDLIQPHMKKWIAEKYSDEIEMFGYGDYE